MMPYRLSFALWLLAGLGTTHAQHRPVTSADTLQAVHRLFQARRTGGVVFSLLGGIYVGMGMATAAESRQPTAGYASAVYSGMSLTTGAPLLAIGLAKLLRFGARREQRILLNYQAGKPLPRSIKTKLRAKHFSAA